MCIVTNSYFAIGAKVRIVRFCNRSCATTPEGIFLLFIKSKSVILIQVTFFLWFDQQTDCKLANQPRKKWLLHNMDDGTPPNRYLVFTARTLHSLVRIVIPYGDRHDSITLDILARRALLGPEPTDLDRPMPPLEEATECICCFICENCCYSKHPLGCKSPDVPRPKCVNSEIKPWVDEPPTQTLHIRIGLYQLRLTTYYHNWKL